MQLPDGCRLMLPGFDAAHEDRIYLYDIQGLIDLRQSDQDLTGHPALDLEGGVTAGWVEVGRAKVAKINRWQEQDRLLRVKRNAGDSYYIGYVERRQWKHLISDEDWHWIEANCDTSLLVSEERYAQIALGNLGEALATVGLAAAKQVKPKQKLQRKERQRLEREAGGAA